MRSTPRKLRMGSNPIAHMSGWSHSARKRKLALSPGVALRSTQVRLTCVAGVTGKGEENERNACSCPFSKPFSNRPHTPKLHRSPSVTSNACVTSNGYLPAAVSLPEWLRGGLKIHCTQVRVGSNPIADMSGWSHSARKRKLALSPGVALRSTQVRLTCVAGVTAKGEETKGTPALAFSLSLFHRSPSVTSNGYLPAAVSLPEWLRGT